MLFSKPMTSPNHPELTPEFIHKALNCVLASPLKKAKVPFSGIISDSRKIIPGCLFVALKGEKFDGHDFIQSAVKQGIRGVLCAQGTPHAKAMTECDFFEVPDTLVAYRQIAAAWRREFKIPVIAIAGSAGKTTTKELLFAILQGKWQRILKTQGSQNGFVGIPMTLLELNHHHEAAVIEIGIDDVGAMQQHISIVSPNAAVLTSIGPEHLERLQDIPTVAREEGIALSYVAAQGGQISINLDDPWIARKAAVISKGTKIFFSLEELENPSSKGEDTLWGKITSDEKRIEIRGLGIQSGEIELPLPGKHNAANLLAALTLALNFGLTLEEMKKGLTTFKGAEGRSQIRHLQGSTTVICDYYNAQPMSMIAGLKLLSQTSKCSRNTKTWACIADMLELGPQEEQFHRDLAKTLSDLKINSVLLYGPRMASLDDELKKRGFSGYHAHFSSQSELASVLIEKVCPGDTVLIKGSRGMKMEEVWKLLESYVKSHWNHLPQSENSNPHC